MKSLNEMINEARQVEYRVALTGCLDRESMKSLYEAIKESLLDAEDTDYTPYLVAKAWANEYMEGKNYEVSKDGTITSLHPLTSSHIHCNRER